MDLKKLKNSHVFSTRVFLVKIRVTTETVEEWKDDLIILVNDTNCKSYTSATKLEFL